TDTLPLMMFSVNNTGKIIYTNKWLQDFFQLSPIQLTNLSLEAILFSEDLKKVFHEWEKSKNTNTIFRAETRLKGKDQSVWHLVSIIPLKVENEVTMTWTGFFVDIHAQKQVEETLKNNIELKEAQKQLVKNQRQLETKIAELNMSNHDLEQFAYIASHDLQEPLRKIRSFSELLGRNLNTDNVVKSRNFLDKIDSSAQRMSTLIKDVLNYSRLSKKDTHFVDADLNSIIKNIKEDFELMIEQKKARIEYPPLPTIKGIPLQLHQLFCNLISNSLKFSETDPVIQISYRQLNQQEIVENVKMDEQFDYIEVLLRDNGIGFEQKYADQIFTIFQRLNDQSKYSGTGIGLALCKKIAENHKGYIRAESALGKGTSFFVYLQVDLESVLA
ncbi:MAG: evgS, partial [Cytophagaceae bacterium]|nr:evgS [Cytophagaceae bacterium]